MAADPIHVRPAEENDRRPLALLFAAVAEERLIGAEPPVEVDKLAAEWHLDGTLVAIAADELVGELRVEPSYFGYGEIGMMVAAAWRGRGVGTALVRESEANLAFRGVRTVLLETATTNEAGIAFWERHGYRKEAVLKNYYSGRLDAFEMRKKLSATPGPGS